MFAERLDVKIVFMMSEGHCLQMFAEVSKELQDAVAYRDKSAIEEYVNARLLSLLHQSRFSSEFERICFTLSTSHANVNQGTCSYIRRDLREICLMHRTARTSSVETTEHIFISCLMMCP